MDNEQRGIQSVGGQFGNEFAVVGFNQGARCFFFVTVTTADNGARYFFVALATADFSCGFQSTESNAVMSASRQRRLNSGVADATRGCVAFFQALKAWLKSTAAYAAKK